MCQNILSVCEFSCILMVGRYLYLEAFILSTLSLKSSAKMRKLMLTLNRKV